jgi:site-specific recombinase XerD
MNSTTTETETLAAMVCSYPFQQTGVDRIKALVLDSVTSPHSKAAYSTALDTFFSWFRTSGSDGFSKATVQAWVAYLQGQGLSSSTINLRLSAVRKLAVEASDNGLMDATLAQGIGRCKGIKRAGVRTGNWLTKQQTEELLLCPDTGRLIGMRDRALLATLVGCGLRRSEVSALTFPHLQQRDARWVIVDIFGKGGRIRSVPMPSWTKVAIDEWSVAAGINEGLVFRSMNNKGALTGSPLLPQNVMVAVTKYGAQIGIPALAPHDLRRTFAKLANRGGSALQQIQLSLGHASIVTTERYLGTSQDLTDAPADHLGIRLAAVAVQALPTSLTAIQEEVVGAMVGLGGKRGPAVLAVRAATGSDFDSLFRSALKQA